MKKVLFTLAAIAAAWMPSQAQKIEFASKAHDFSTIKEADGAVSHDFEFTNTGDMPLVIKSAKASCGCTKPQFPREPVAPGKSSRIKVTYNPLGRPGEFSKDVVLKTNDPKHRRVTLRITGTVIPKK